VAAVPTAILAPNPSAMTLDGTRTFVVGRGRVAVIDPGPDIPSHIDAVARVVGDASAPATIVLTHDHADHAEGAAALAARLGGAPVLAHAAGTLADGDVIETDAGPLTVVHTPGHTPDHVSFHHAVGRAVYCGDLMTGGMDTAWVGLPDGDLDDYLASLERLRALRPDVILPAHGPAIEDPPKALAAYVAHRAEREAQVLAALAAGARDVNAVAEAVYGGRIEAALLPYAAAATAAYLIRLERAGRVTRADDLWRATP
jgi:glyoxylase-like metal-dependent hydrolase (beta-lactamase superfamily II)